MSDRARRVGYRALVSVDASHCRVASCSEARIWWGASNALEDAVSSVWVTEVVEALVVVGLSRVAESWSGNASCANSVLDHEAIRGALVDRNTFVRADALSSTSTLSFAERSARGGVGKVVADRVTDRPHYSLEVKEAVHVVDMLVNWRRGDLRDFNWRRNVHSDCVHDPSFGLSSCNVRSKELGHAVVESIGEDDHHLWDWNWAVWIWLVCGRRVDTTVDTGMSSSLNMVVEKLLDGGLVKTEGKYRVAQSTANGRVLSWKPVNSTEEYESDLGLIWPNSETVNQHVRESKELGPLIRMDGPRLIKNQDEVDWSLAKWLDWAVCAWWDDKDGSSWHSFGKLREFVRCSVKELSLADFLRAWSNPNVFHISRVCWIDLFVGLARPCICGD